METMWNSGGLEGAALATGRHQPVAARWQVLRCTGCTGCTGDRETGNRLRSSSPRTICAAGLRTTWARQHPRRDSSRPIADSQNCSQAAGQNAGCSPRGSAPQHDGTSCCFPPVVDEQRLFAGAAHLAPHQPQSQLPFGGLLRRIGRLVCLAARWPRGRKQPKKTAHRSHSRRRLRRLRRLRRQLRPWPHRCRRASARRWS